MRQPVHSLLSFASDFVSDVGNVMEMLYGVTCHRKYSYLMNRLMILVFDV